MKSLPIIFSVFCIIVTASCASNMPASTSTPTNSPAQILFDDFSYSTADEMIANGWILRSEQGLHGVTGASFRPENGSFIDYTSQPAYHLLRMTSSTACTSANTYQTQICHQRKYLEGK